MTVFQRQVNLALEQVRLTHQLKPDTFLFKKNVIYRVWLVSPMLSCSLCICMAPQLLCIITVDAEKGKSKVFLTQLSAHNMRNMKRKKLEMQSSKSQDRIKKWTNGEMDDKSQTL